MSLIKQKWFSPFKLNVILNGNFFLTYTYILGTLYDIEQIISDVIVSR